MRAAEGVGGAAPEGERFQFVESEEVGADGVFQIVDVVGEAIGDGDDLRLDAGRWEMRRVVRRGGDVVAGVVDGESVADGAGEVESAEGGEGVFEVFDDAEGVGVVVESAVVAQEFVEGGLAGVSEGRVTEVVGQGDGFGERFVDAEGDGEGAGDLGDFEGVGEAGAEMVVVGGGEDLGLVFESAESGGLDDALAVAVEGGAEGVGGFVVVAAGGVGAGAGGAGGEMILVTRRRGIMSHERSPMVAAWRTSSS